MMNESQPQPANRERNLAVLAHAGIIAYFLGSITGPFWVCFIFPVFPIVVLAMNKSRDKWLSFHAWQALIHQIILSVIFFFVGIPAFLIVFSKCAPFFGYTGCDPVYSRLWLVSVFVLFVFPLIMVFLSLFGAVRLLTGRDFEYPLIARPTRKFLKIG